MAANDIDKGISQAPQGLTEEDLTSMLGEPDLEIEIEDPEEVNIKIGGLELEIDPDEMDDGFNDNLDIDRKLVVKYFEQGDVVKVIDGKY